MLNRGLSLKSIIPCGPVIASWGGDLLGVAGLFAAPL